MLEIRSPSSEAEFDAVFAATHVAFGEDVPEDGHARARSVMPRERVLAAFEGSEPVGVAAALAFELTVPGALLPAAGVTWVGVLPTHRRRGILTDLMRRQLEDTHRLGEPVAALWASEAPIYGRFGYGLATVNAGLDADKARFAFRDDAGPRGAVRLVTPEEAGRVFPELYERVRRSQPGMISRPPAWWEAKLSDPEGDRDGASQKYNLLLELDGEPAGFARYRIAPKWDGSLPAQEVLVIEAIPTSTDALRELWRYLFSIDLTARVKARYFDPSSPLFLMVTEPRRLRVALADGIWLRLVDVGESLRRRSYATGDSAVLDVVDDFCPWNTGRFRAGADAGPTDDAAELRLGVGELASVYLGGFGFAALHRAGLVDERAPGAVERADALFRTLRPPHCPEDF
jgi:predicted acetyltransferase